MTAQSLRPIVLYGNTRGPNPAKVMMLLETLGLPYTYSIVAHDKVKSEPYTLLNPNGRLPAIEDPNNTDENGKSFVIWESGAIVLYLVERYDTEHKFSFPQGTNASFEALQWLIFQVSGQGPYYGQAAWFKIFHHEKLPSAVERYINEIERVIGVIDSYLERENLQFLVRDVDDAGKVIGNGKFSFADLSFVPWHGLIDFVAGDKDIFKGGKKYEHYKAWIDRVMSQNGVKKALQIQQEAMKEEPQHWTTDRVGDTMCP